MFCEFRKIVVPEGREQGGSKTTQTEYATLWQAAAPVCARVTERSPPSNMLAASWGGLLARVAQEWTPRNNALGSVLPPGDSWPELRRSR